MLPLSAFQSIVMVGAMPTCQRSGNADDEVLDLTLVDRRAPVIPSERPPVLGKRAEQPLLAEKDADRRRPGLPLDLAERLARDGGKHERRPRAPDETRATAPVGWRT